MASFYATYPFEGGSGGGVPTYANLAAFPSAITAGNGALAIALDSDILYISNGTSWEVLADPTISPFAITALHGDGVATGPGDVALTLATVNSNVGTFGTTSEVPVFTVNAKGLVTAVSEVFITIDQAHVTNLVTDLAAKVPNTRTISTTAPLTGGGDLSADRTFAMPAATTSVNGYLTSTDWNTFNGKQASGSYITALTGDVTATGPGSVAATIANLAVTNAKIANATIDLTTKVTGILPGANGGTGVNSTATFPTSGVVVTEAASETLTNKTINGSNNTITNVSLSTGVTGTLPLLNGGTGTAAASANAAFNALSPLTTKGDLIGFSTVNARLGVGANDTLLIADSAQTLGVRWGTPSGLQDSPLDLKNYSLAASVATSALTITLNDKAGSTPSSGSPCNFGIRSATNATGTYSILSVTAATSITIPSGATLGQLSGSESMIYVYIINNSGTGELAVSSQYYRDTQRVTTTTIGAGSTSATGFYSTTGRSNVAARLIGRMQSAQTAAGTWAALPDIIDLNDTFLTEGQFGTISGLAMPPGYVGEVAQGLNNSGTSLTTGVFSDIASVVLGGGIWKITGLIEFSPNGSVLGNTQNQLAISGFSANTTTDHVRDLNQIYTQGVIVGQNNTFTIPDFYVRINSQATTYWDYSGNSYTLPVPGTATFYIKALAGFSAGAYSAFGRITAARPV